MSKECRRRPKLLLIGYPKYLSDTVWNDFCSRYTIIHYEFRTKADFYKSMEYGSCANLDGILHISFNTPPEIEPLQQGWTTQALPYFPSSLRVIVKFGHGYESEDIPGLKSQNIEFYNSTGGSYSTAIIGLYLIIAAFRRLSQYERMARDGAVVAAMRESAYRCEDPYGKHLGILGMGAIGQELARQATAIGMQVHCLARKSLTLSDDLSKVVRVSESLEALVEKVDCLALACSYSLSSHHLLNSSLFAKMKPGMKIVNVSRGKCIDEEALVVAVETGVVTGVGLDVYENEPKIHPKLLENDCVTVLPHIGGMTKDAFENHEKICIEHMNKALEEGFIHH